MSLKIKYSVFITLLIFIVLSSLTILLIVSRTNQIKGDLTDKDKIISDIAVQQLANGFADYYFYQYSTYLDFVTERIKIYPDIIHFTMYNTDSEILFDSVELQTMKPSPKVKTTDKAMIELINKQKSKVETATYNGQQVLRITAPFIDKYGTYRDMFVFDFSLKKVRSAVRETIVYFLSLLIIFTSVSLLAAFLLASQVVKPIVALQNAANTMSQGNLDTAVEVHSHDEIEALATSFNKMATDLKALKNKLEEQNKSLQSDVVKQNEELQKKIADMEELQKMMVNRELKMIELKNEIAQLKGEKSTGSQ